MPIYSKFCREMVCARQVPWDTLLADKKAYAPLYVLQGAYCPPAAQESAKDALEQPAQVLSMPAIEKRMDSLLLAVCIEFRCWRC